MKLIITGSLGNISKPLTKILRTQNHDLTVVTSNPEKKVEIEALGAKAAIGSVADPDFLTKTFSGADAAYCMVPPNHFSAPDVIQYAVDMANSYAQAIRNSGIKRIVHLSTYGTHLDHGTGLILGSFNIERILNAIPHISLTHLRPTYFYYNVNAFINMIKTVDAIRVNYGGDPIVMVAPPDIATVAAEELTASAPSVRYISSDSPTGAEVARILGTAIGKPDLKWEVISDEEMARYYQSVGMPPHIITGMVEMMASIRTGKLTEDYYKHEPATKGKIKFTDYAKTFAELYNKSN